MLERVKLGCVLGTVYVTMELIPRALRTLFYLLPKTLLELFTGRRPFTFQKERQVHVVSAGAAADAAKRATSERLKKALGLDQLTRYTGPLYNGHVHTIFGGARLPSRITYEREYAEAADGTPSCMDWLYVDGDATSMAAKGVVWIIPGFGNYSQTPYVQQLARLAVRRGLHVCVMTARAIASAPHVNPMVASAILSLDARAILRQKLRQDKLKERCGRALPLFAVGYSVGCSMLLATLAEEETAMAEDAALYPEGFPVKALIVMNPAYSPQERVVQMQTPIGRRLYKKIMVDALRKIHHKHAEVMANGIANVPGLGPDNATSYYREACTSMERYEEMLIAPHHGYDTVEDYYQACNLLPFLRQLQHVAVVCVTARDDPIVGYPYGLQEMQELADTSKGPIFYVETPTGGHLGYLGTPCAELRGQPGFLVSFPLRCILTCINSKTE